MNKKWLWIYANSMRTDDGWFHPIGYRILTNLNLLLLSLVIDITWSAESTPGTLAVRTFFICPKLTFIYPISYMDEIFYELSMDHRDYKNASAYQNFRGLHPAYRAQNFRKRSFIFTNFLSSIDVIQKHSSLPEYTRTLPSFY